MTGMDHSSEWCADDEQIVRVAITDLRRSRSPRVSGEDPQHIRALAESDAELPPIIVHRATMRVIDGMHRLRAAELRDRDEIDVRFFDGDESDAFVLAVRANVTHGLPLSLTDRKAAAARIVAAHPDWSDRLIASRTGLAAKTVATMRDENEDPATHDDSRVGQDGRIRPVDSSAGRQIAGDLIAENPGLSLRQVARRAGISPETVRDVRGRLRRGEDPIPKQRDEHDQADTPPADHPPLPTPPPHPDLAAVIHRLRADPALRLNGAGRALLKILDANTVISGRFDSILANVPPHCREVVANAAWGCAGLWRSLAAHLDEAEGTV
jgi:ParB-like chromosome segregation protein Spo0J